MADIESLLAATTQDPPCGPNLEYETPFLTLMSAQRGKPEQQIGATIIPAEMPDWDAVQKQAEALLVRSKDLRIAVALVRALTRVNHLPGLYRGLRLLQGLLEQFWEQIHPLPDPDDPEDIVIRFNTLALLVDPQAVLSDVRCALVVSTGPHGHVSVRDLLVATGRVLPAQGETVISYKQVENALADAAAKNPQLLQTAGDCVGAINAISDWLSNKTGFQRGVDFGPLLALIKPVAQVCSSVAMQHSVSLQGDMVMQEETIAAQDTNALMPKATHAVLNEIRNRDDAMRVLDAVCLYYEKAEPGNPAPLLIQRAQRLMNKSFVEIMQDLAPDSLEQIRQIAGLKKEGS